MKENPSKKAVIIISVILVILFVFCLYIILSKPTKRINGGYIANIYSDGKLVKTVDLSEGIPETFIIGDKNKDYNEIEVTGDGKIGVISASCPDKLCVHQGFMSLDTIPIVCLPNRLTIVLQSKERLSNAPDVMTYD